MVQKQGPCLFLFTVGSLVRKCISKRISRVSFYLLPLGLAAVYIYICDYFVLKVAVLIPFRNRHEHLPIFFLHLIPMLQKQRLEFAFYVIEQVRLVFKMVTRYTRT